MTRPRASSRSINATTVDDGEHPELAGGDGGPAHGFGEVLKYRDLGTAQVIPQQALEHAELDAGAVGLVRGFLHVGQS
jgi:hypothetical protein